MFHITGPVLIGFDRKQLPAYKTFSRPYRSLIKCRNTALNSDVFCTLMSSLLSLHTFEYPSQLPAKARLPKTLPGTALKVNGDRGEE